MTWAAPLLLAFASLVAGCSHYVLGTGHATPFKKLYVEPVVNAAALPQSVALISTEIREAFIRDGRLQMVNSPDDADVILSTKLGSYGREIATVVPNDTGLARKFVLNLSATITLAEPGSGKVYFKDRPLLVKRQVFTNNPQTGNFDNQLQAEYQAVPLLAQSLSASAVSHVLDVW